jgi:hypothetical protein
MFDLNPGGPTYYSIRIKGHIAPRWSTWFEGLTITHLNNGETMLCGPVSDQAALHGLLAKIRDLNLMLISIAQVEFRE